MSFRYLLIFLFSNLAAAKAFPPSPDFTIFGIVRDQVGQRLPGNSTSYLLMLNQGVEIRRTPLSSSFLDQNYELGISVDANRPGTVLYRDSALPANSPLELAVELNGQRFYPIEVHGNLNIGQGGERLRLDLNLGTDSDGDGLPDTWEEWQLYQAGILPGSDGTWDLSLINREGDFDKDGQMDGLEYIAGTFAGDASETFELKIDSHEEGTAHFTFYQITGKIYTLERSLDGENWERVSFLPTGAQERADSYRAPQVGLLSASAPGADNTALYRLTVR